MTQKCSNILYFVLSWPKKDKNHGYVSCTATRISLCDKKLACNRAFLSTFKSRHKYCQHSATVSTCW